MTPGFVLSYISLNLTLTVYAMAVHDTKAIFAFVAAYIILKEKEDMYVKIPAMILVGFGSILLAFS